MSLYVHAKHVEEYCLQTHKFGKEGFFCKAICVRDLKVYMLKGNIPIVTVFEFHIINFSWKLVFSKILYW